MLNYEIYIDNRLADLGQDFGVRLNRQLLNPAELNTKDAQYSYSIFFPATDVNNDIFKYANVEETADKFNARYTAELIIGGVQVFKGNFQPSEISARGYKGNLYIPNLKTVKDIFGAAKLNETAPYWLPFGDFAQSVSDYNEAAANGPQMAIFPAALYGLLPKVPLNKNENTYSGRTTWDASTFLGMADLPPSVNPLLMLRHLFQSKGYNLTGSAFDDERLTNIYQSYKNPTDYVQPWNYGYQAYITIAGDWSSTHNFKVAGSPTAYEKGVNQSSDESGAIYSVDMLDATNSRVNIIQDTGGNVLLKEVNDNAGTAWTNGLIRVPASGFYRVEFIASLKVYDNQNWRHTDAATGVQHISGYTENAGNGLNNQNVYEVRLLRDRKRGDFGLSGAKLNGTFLFDNQPQQADSLPRYYPQITTGGQLNFVDLAQDRNHLLGFQFGANGDGGEAERYLNPRDTGNRRAQMLAAKPALSWRNSENDGVRNLLAIKSPGYWKYGRIGDFDSEGDNPNVNIDYSGGNIVNGAELDNTGQLISPTGQLDQFSLNRKIHNADGAIGYLMGWKVTGLLKLSDYTGLKFSGDFPDDNNSGLITAFYDVNGDFLGGVDAPATGGGTYVITNQMVGAGPAGAEFVRISGPMDTLVVEGTAASTADTKILYRFPVANWFTYKFTTPPASLYSGYVYVYDGSVFKAAVPFVNGEAVVDMSYAGASALTVSLYLKNPSADVSGSLVISRTVTGNADVIDWEVTNKLKIDLNNSPYNYALRGYFDGFAADSNWNGDGALNAIVWLEAGELLTVASISSEGRYRRNGMHSTFGMVNHRVKFSVKIEPFRIDQDWYKVDLAGRSTEAMDWNLAGNFDTDKINIMGFLNKDMKADEYIENFCKAFNLKLSQVAPNTFSLDVRQTKNTTISSQYIDLDGVASVRDRLNTPLGLPAVYRIGFTVDEDEIGYQETQDNGGGEFTTGVEGEAVVEQKSIFSYNWYKNFTKVQTSGTYTLPLPVISKADVWANTMGYGQAMAKRYTDQAYRFWYFDGLLNSTGATFDFNGNPLKLARVAEARDRSELNYKNRKYTILDNYFTLLINGSSHYTEVEGYLTPEMYQELDGARLCHFNGDLYYIAEVQGYDPAGRNKAKLKLIRKIK